MVSSIRIFGGAIGEVRGYVDVDITGVTQSGAIVLTEQGSTAEHAIDLERLVELFEEGLAYDLANVDTTAEDWGAIDDLEARYVASAASDKSHFVEAAKVVFRGAE